MARAGALWWVYAWLAWVGFQVLMLVLYPTVIAPLFNKFEPLTDAGVKERIEALLRRCGFAARGLFVMDGSKRSAHGNAYFTGFGAATRIVFFDTLLARLARDEIEAVLAHELGHFKLRHVSSAPPGSRRQPGAAGAARLADRPVLVLCRPGRARARRRVTASRWCCSSWRCRCSRSLPRPLAALYSRRHEFEPISYAARNASATALIAALVKLYEDNANTLTPDPLAFGVLRFASACAGAYRAA